MTKPKKMTLKANENSAVMSTSTDGPEVPMLIGLGNVSLGSARRRLSRTGKTQSLQYLEVRRGAGEKGLLRFFTEGLKFEIVLRQEFHKSHRVYSPAKIPAFGDIEHVFE